MDTGHSNPSLSLLIGDGTDAHALKVLVRALRFLSKFPGWCHSSIHIQESPTEAERRPDLDVATRLCFQAQCSAQPQALPQNSTVNVHVIIFNIFSLLNKTLAFGKCVPFSLLMNQASQIFQ